MSHPRISFVLLERFRSHAGENRPITLGDVTFIVGKNAAGKSNFLDAFSVFSELVSEPLVAILDRRGGMAALKSRVPGQHDHEFVNIGIAVESDAFDATYGFSISEQGAYGFSVASERCIIEGKQSSTFWRTKESFSGIDQNLRPVLNDHSLALPIIGGLKPFSDLVDLLEGIRIYSISPQTLREAHPADEGHILSKNGSNAASVVRQMRSSGTLHRVLEFLRAAVPQIHDVSTKREGAKLALEFIQDLGEGKTASFEAFEMSDGTLRVLGLLLALLQEPRPVLIGLEEPEVHVHPGALGVILDAIRFTSESTQVVVTTQSADLLDADWIQSENIRIVEWSNGISKVSTMPEGAAEVIRRHLQTPGELLRAGALSGVEPS